MLNDPLGCVRLKLLVNVYYDMEKQIDYRVCAFCNVRIEKGSICDDCSKKYNVKIYNSSEDGCGCDTK